MPLSAYLHTVDLCVLFYCRTSGELKLLLNKRDAEPFAGHWALPGVVVNGGVQDLSLKDAVERLRASDKVGLELAWSEQVGTVGDAFRDPRCWSSSTYYLAIVADEVTLAEHQAPPPPPPPPLVFAECGGGRQYQAAVRSQPDRGGRAGTPAVQVAVQQLAADVSGQGIQCAASDLRFFPWCLHGPC